MPARKPGAKANKFSKIFLDYIALIAYTLNRASFTFSKGAIHMERNFEEERAELLAATDHGDDCDTCEEPDCEIDIYELDEADWDDAEPDDDGYGGWDDTPDEYFDDV